MTLGERIKLIRQSLKWTQDKLAQEAQISKSFLSEIENDKTNVSGDSLLKIANALNTSLDYLMKGENIDEGEKPKLVEIPSALSDMADARGLSYRSTLKLLSIHHSLIAKRSSREKKGMKKEDWQDLYDRLKLLLDRYET